MVLQESSLYYKIVSACRFLLVSLFHFKRMKVGGLGLFGSNLTFIVNPQGNVALGRKCIIAPNAFVQSKGELSIGNNFFLNSYSRIVCHERIVIGDNVTVAANVTVLDHDHQYELLEHGLSLDGYDCQPVTIGSNVWIGEKVIILKGVTIGRDSIIAAGSVVNKSVPEKSLIAGMPAKVIRSLDS